MTDEQIPEPTYFEVMLTHMLHRIWELQVAQLVMQADTDEDLAYIEDIVEKQRQGDYTTPLEW